MLTTSRNPEKRAGLIIDKDDDYKSFFKVAKQNGFNIIFDGLGIEEKPECNSVP